MGTCISIHNNINEHSYINVSIIINNKVYSLYTSITNIDRWYIYLPNFIIEKIYENNSSYEIIIIYSKNGKIYKSIYSISNYNIEIKDSKSYYIIKLLYRKEYISQIYIIFKR
jgi:hypothetical protein